MTSIKSIAVAFVGMVLLTIGVVIPASAEVVVSAKGGAFWMEKDNYQFSKGALTYGFSLQYLPPVENRVIDVGIEYMTGQTKRPAFPGSAGLLNTITGVIRYDAIIGTMHYRPPVSTSIQPYIGAGVGWYAFTYTLQGQGAVSFVTPPHRIRQAST